MVPSRCIRRNVRQVVDGRRRGAPGRFGMYLATVSLLTSWPSLASSAAMRRRLHIGFCRVMRSRLPARRRADGRGEQRVRVRRPQRVARVHRRLTGRGDLADDDHPRRGSGCRPPLTGLPGPAGAAEGAVRPRHAGPAADATATSGAGWSRASGWCTARARWRSPPTHGCRAAPWAPRAAPRSSARTPRRSPAGFRSWACGTRAGPGWPRAWPACTRWEPSSRR